MSVDECCLVGVMDDMLLFVENLKVYFCVLFGGYLWLLKGMLCVVDGVLFDVKCGEMVGFVGELGCGKLMLVCVLIGFVLMMVGIVKWCG